MNETPAPRLTGEQVMVLRFAAHRQLARWSNKPKLTPRQYAQRTELRGAVRILQDVTFNRGCELHPRDAEGTDGDG